MIEQPRAPNGLRPASSLPVLARGDWEAILNRFDDMWLSGSMPRIEDFLPADSGESSRAVETQRHELLVELIKIDLEYRWRTNAPRWSIEDYVDRFPVLGRVSDLHAGLIAEEYRVRRQWGDRPDRIEFAKRYPEQIGRIYAEFDRVDSEVAAESAAREPTRTRETPRESPRATQPSRPDAESPPILAGFEILELLGRGGMGVVYKARQTSLNRVVAIKMIRAAGHASPRERARFRAEAEAAARLQHPNIVQVYEIGEHDGRPFCVLEFIADGSLAERLAESPLPPREAAQLVRTLARAVQFAHKHGIVHRDLKPSNVLLQRIENQGWMVEGRNHNPEHECQLRFALDPEPSALTPKIADFGLAKRLDGDASQTHSGTMLGTPSYMAPEQAAGGGRAADPAADVYSLGAILYECLTGRPPFRAATTLETLDLVRTQEPVAPSRLALQTPRDVETICLKCLAKSPHWRYASAAELADDLDRFLSHRPILARRAGPVERAIKWSRRRPTSAAVAAVALVAVLGLALGGAVHNTQLQEAARQADQQKQRADENFTRAFDAVNRMLDRVGFDRLADVPEMEGVRRELLGEAVEFYNGLLAHQDDPSPTARREYAGAYLRLGQIDHLLGEYDQAERHITRSIELHRRLAEEFPADPKHRSDLALAQFQLGRVLTAANRRPEAEPQYLAAIAAWNEIEQEVPECRGNLSAACIHVARLFGETRRPDRAAEFYNEALTRIDSLARDEPENVNWQSDRALVRHNLGLFYVGTSRHSEAEALLREAIAIWESLETRRPLPSQTAASLAECYTGLAFLMDATRAADGDDLLQRALLRRTELARRFPSVPAHQDAVARAQHNIGTFFQLTGRGSLAASPLTEAVAIRERLVAEFPQVGIEQSLAESCNNLAVLLQYTGRAVEARPLLQRAIEIQETLVRDHPESSRYPAVLAASLTNFGNLLRESGDAAASLEILNRAMSNLDGVLRSEPENNEARTHLIHASGARAQTLDTLGRHADAIADWDRVVDIAPSAARTSYRVMRATSLIRAGQTAQAIAEAEEIAASTAEPNTQYNVACVYALASGATAADRNVDPDRQPSTSLDAPASRAVKLLDQLFRRGYFLDPAHAAKLRADRDLDAIRGTAEFQKLLAALESK